VQPVALGLAQLGAQLLQLPGGGGVDQVGDGHGAVLLIGMTLLAWGAWSNLQTRPHWRHRAVWPLALTSNWWPQRPQAMVMTVRSQTVRLT
jgi:hypothetical protein